MKPRLSSLPFLPVLSLAACMSTPADKEHSGPLLPASYPVKHPVNWDAGTDWKRFYTGEILQELIEEALKHNRDLRIALLNVDAARARHGISRSRRYPSLEGNLGAEYNHIPEQLASVNTSSQDKLHELSIGVTSYELDLFGRVRSLERAALEEYLASRAARDGARIALIAEVASLYLEICADTERIELAKQTLETADTKRELMNKRHRAGAASEIEVRSLDIQVETTRASLARATRAWHEAQNALQELAGNGAVITSAPSSGCWLADGLDAGMPSDLLTRRPDIIEAEHRLQMANANIAAARAAFFPQIVLTGRAGVVSGSLGNLFSGNNAVWSFAPRITIPIFDGGHNQASLDETVVHRDISLAHYERTIQRAFREVLDGLTNEQGYRDSLRATTALVKAREQHCELIEKRHAQGAERYSELLSARLDLYGARQELIDLRLAREMNAVALYKALGGGW